MEADIDVGSTVHAALKFLLGHVHKTSDPPNQTIAAQHATALESAFAQIGSSHESISDDDKAISREAELSVGIAALYSDGEK